MNSRTVVDLLEPRSPRYSSLDMWRGVACLAVVVVHSIFYSHPAIDAHGLEGIAALVMQGCTWLWLGVPMFFVISGYCISATADSSRRKSATTTSYFIRRFRRIYPPYWALLGMSCLLVGVCEYSVWPGLFSDENHPFSGPWSLSGWQWVGNLSLTESWRSHFVGGGRSYLLGHAWTLCYEEQFYIVCGIILLIAPRHFFSAAAIVSLLVVAAAPVAHKFRLQGFFFDGHWVLFAAGIVVYYHVNYASKRFCRLIEGSLILGMAACWIDPLHHWAVGSIEQHGLIAFGFALTLILTRRWDRQIANSRWTQPLQFCGTMCYSLYLVHYPISKGLSHALYLAGLESNLSTLLVTVPACLATSLAVAWPFHVFIERRFLNATQASHVKIANGLSQPEATLATSQRAA